MPVSLSPLFLMTLSEAATASRVCKRTIESLIATGDLPVVKLGRRSLIDPKDLAEFFERQKIRKPKTDSPPLAS